MENQKLEPQKANEQKQSNPKKVIKKPAKHICRAEHPRRCLCWKCIRDMCEICYQIF